MAAVVRSTTLVAGTLGGGGSTSVALPSGTVAGNLIVGEFWAGTTDLNVAWSDSMTQLHRTSTSGSGSGSSATAWKIVTSTDVTRGTIRISNNGLNSDYQAILVRIEGHPASSPIDASSQQAATLTAPGVTASGVDTLLLAFAAGSSGTSGGIAYSAPAGMALLASRDLYPQAAVASQALSAAGATGDRTWTASGLGQNPQAAGLVAIKTANVAPNAPTLVAPLSGTLDSTVTQRFSWNFTDPNTGDTQSKYDLRYRLTSATTWTTVSGTTPNTFRDFAAGTFAAGDYEWQVRAYDAAGVVGPYSTSGFFTAAAPPAGPTITAPTNGSTVSTATTSLTWSYPTQSSYQVRQLGSADAVVYDSGIVASTVARSLSLTFDTNNVTRKLQVRVQDSGTGLWSPYSTVTVTVSFTPPAVPSLTLTSDSSAGSITVLPVPGLYNLLTAQEASFDVDAAATWVGANNASSLTVVSTPTHSGAGALSFTATATSTVSRVRTPAHGTVRQGATYTVSAWVRSGTVARDIGLSFAYYNGYPTTGGQSAYAYATTSTTGWTLLTTSLTVENATDGLFTLLVQVRDVVAGEVFYVDTAQVIEGTSTTWEPGGTPETTGVDVYRRETAAGGDGIRIATMRPPRLPWADLTPASGVDYEYRVDAVASNGTTASSDWNGADSADGGGGTTYGSDAYGAGVYGS